MSTRIERRNELKYRATGAFNAPVAPRNIREYIGQAKMAILITLLAIQNKGQKHYCQPAPDTIITLLSHHQRIKMERRWLFQCLHDLEALGYISRQRRWDKNGGAEIISLPSLWWFTIKGARFLTRKTITGAKSLLNNMLNWLKRNDKRQPTYKSIAESEIITDREEALRKINGILRGVFKEI